MIDPCPVPTLHWWQWHPPVGTFIGILGGLGVIVPWLFRPPDKMGRTEKAVWTLLMLLFVWLEIRTLYLDRDEHDAQQEQARCQQLQSFQQIANGIEDSNKKSADQFETTMKTLGPTLQAATTTLDQTRPHALLHFSHDTTKAPPSGISGGKVIGWNSPYVNDGEIDAYISRLNLQIYVAKPLDLVAQKDLLSRFDTVWKKIPIATELVKIGPKDGGFTTSMHTLSEDELARIKNGETVYFVGRIEYRDSTGVWYSDICEHLQTLDTGITHPCKVFTKDRYPATR